MADNNTIQFNDLDKDKAKKPQGSGFVNTQQYVNANQNNKLGQAVGGGIQQANQNAQQNVQQGQQEFQDQSNANKFDTDQNKNIVQGVLADPASAAKNDQNQFTHLISGQYQGPQGIQNQQQLQSQIQDVGNLGQATGSASGQIGLLQRFVGKPQYSTGQQKLDQLVLGQTGAPQLQQARTDALQLQAKTPGIFQGAQAQAQQYGNEAQQFGQNVQNQFGQTVAGIDTGLKTQATQAQAAKDAAFKKIQDDLSSGKITQDEANKLGIQAGQMTYNVDPNKFLSVDPTLASAQNVAGQQDYARINALRQLAGGFAPQDAQNTLQNYFGQDANAGKFNSDISADKSGYQAAIAKDKGLYDSQLNPAQSSANQSAMFNNWASGNLSAADKQAAMNFLNSGKGYDAGLQLSTDQSGNIFGTGIGSGAPKTDFSKGNLTNQQLGQAMWQKYLTDTYGSLNGGGNSPVLDSGWASGVNNKDQQNLKDTLERLKKTYGDQKYQVGPEDLENMPVVK